MVDPQTTLGEQLLDLAIGERKAQVPADREQDHLRLKLAPLEQSGNRWGEEHRPSLSVKPPNLQHFREEREVFARLDAERLRLLRVHGDRAELDEVVRVAPTPCRAAAASPVAHLVSISISISAELSQLWISTQTTISLERT
jgi:hypothetical protein